MTGDQEHDQNARSEFNEQAAASLQHHYDDLNDSRKIADDAAKDLQSRKNFRRHRAESMHDKKRAA